MKDLISHPWLGHEFDNFLFATIGEDRNGLLLSVASALGRSNLDPWEEAASLAGLPKVVAAQRFSKLLGALHYPVLQQNSDAIAARLVALLPQQTRSDLRLTQPLIDGNADPHTRVRKQLLSVGFCMIFLLGIELVVAHFRPTHINNTPANESTAAPVQTLPTPYR